jgi:hypothetical protein
MKKASSLNEEAFNMLYAFLLGQSYFTEYAFQLR